MTPAPTPRPQITEGITRGLHLVDLYNHLGEHLGSTLVSFTHVHAGSPLGTAAPVAATLGLGIAGVSIGVWTWKRRHHLWLSVRGVASAKVWRERIRWHRRTKGKKMHGGMTAPRSFAGWPTRSGATLWMRCKDGGNMKVLEDLRPEFASEMACRDLSFVPVPHNQAQALMEVCRRDSLAEVFPWPWLGREQTDFLGPIPAGVDRNGKPVYIDLREHCVLVGGGTGSGKSWWLHTIVAAAVADPRVRVHIIDGKWGSGFQSWEPAVDSFATNDVDEIDQAFRIVRALEKKVNGVYAAQRLTGKRSIDWATATDVDLLVIDEFTAVYGHPGMAKSLANLVARGRAAGLILILTTQRPSTKIIDSDFRELFHFRVAMWSDRNGSKMILGDGVEADSSEFSGTNPGEMFLLAQDPERGREPIRCRGYSLTDRDLANLAARAAALRPKDETGNGSRSNDEATNDPASGPSDPVLVPFANVTELCRTGSAQSDSGEPQKPLEDYQRATLALLEEHGPQVTVKYLARYLPGPEGPGVSERTCQRRLDRLDRLGLAHGARRAHRPGEGEGAREPILWSVTPAGRTLLTSDLVSAEPAQGGAQ